ncbi:MAG: transporter [Rhodospirillales bacterium]|nr:transporter [Rhodospirillales bacterium]
MSAGVHRGAAAACPVLDHEVAESGTTSQVPLSSRSVKIMAVAGGIAVANLYYNQPMLPEIGASFAAPPAIVATLPMLTQLGYAAGLFLFVPLGDIIDRRRLVFALIAGVCLSLVGLALAPSLAWLDVASFLLGMCSVLAQVLVAFAGQLAAPVTRGRIIGTLLAGILLGILMARTISGLVSEHLGWRVMYWIAATASLGMVLVLDRALPRAPAVAPLPYLQTLLSLRDLWREHRQLRRSSMVGGLLFAAFSVFWSTLAFHLAAPPFDYGPQVAGLYGLLGATGAATAPLAGRLTDRRGGGFTVGLGSIVTAVAFPLFALGNNSLLLLGFGAVVLDIGIQGAMIGNQSTVLSLAPKATSRTNTIYMVIYFLGGALGSYTGGLAWHVLGWLGVCVLGFAYAVAASTLHVAGREGRTSIA